MIGAKILQDDPKNDASKISDICQKESAKTISECPDLNFSRMRNGGASLKHQIDSCIISIKFRQFF